MPGRPGRSWGSRKTAIGHNRGTKDDAVACPTSEFLSELKDWRPDHPFVKGWRAALAPDLQTALSFETSAELLRRLLREVDPTTVAALARLPVLADTPEEATAACTLIEEIVEGVVLDVVMTPRDQTTGDGSLRRYDGDVPLSSDAEQLQIAAECDGLRARDRELMAQRPSER